MAGPGRGSRLVAIVGFEAVGKMHFVMLTEPQAIPYASHTRLRDDDRGMIAG